MAIFQNYIDCQATPKIRTKSKGNNPCTILRKSQLIILLNRKCLLILHGVYGGLLKHLRFIQSMLGYSNSEATEIYAHITTKGV